MNRNLYVMKVMVVNEFGGLEVFEFVEIEKLVFGDNQILIEVKVLLVNLVDYKIRDGRMGFLVFIKFVVFYLDCVGVVIELGLGVEDFFIGDEVYCFVSGLGGKFGVFVEYMVVDVSMVVKKLMKLFFEEVVVLLFVVVIVWYCLVDWLEIDESILVFIEGGIGGVGYVVI